MKRHLAPVAALLISVSILLTGQGLQGALLPMRATIENFSPIAVGAMGAAYFFGFTLGCLKAGELVKRVGHVRVFLSMTALASAAPLIHSLVVMPWTWGFLRFVTGFCFAVLYVVIESWLNEQATNETRGAVFSAYTLITLTMMAPTAAGAAKRMRKRHSPKERPIGPCPSSSSSRHSRPVSIQPAKSAIRRPPTGRNQLLAR